MKKIFSLLLFLITLSLYASETGAMPPPPRCEQYTYSTCPSYGCEKTCKSSTCSGNICTADCDGPGSCHLPVAKSCIKLGERFAFYTSNQFCCDGLTRANGKDTKGMIPGYTTCIKIDRICDSKYENSWNSPLDCKNQGEEFKIIGGGVELLNNKYSIKKGDTLKITTLVNTTKIKSNSSLYYDTVIYDENGKKIASCKDKKISINCKRTQLKAYCELNYFKTYFPDGKKYKILTQVKIKQNGKTYSKDLSNSFIIGKKENKKIPEKCISWYDGCNTCSVKDGIIGACTKRYCIRHDTPKCLKYEKEEISCPIIKLVGPKEEGCYYIFTKDKNGCELPKLICKLPKPCPVFKLITPKEGCHYDYIKDKNGCKIPKLVCEEQIYKYKLTDSLKKRIKGIVEKYMQKLKYSKMSNEAKIRKVENILKNLKILSNKKPKLKNIFDYLILLMEEEAVILNIGF